MLALLSLVAAALLVAGCGGNASQVERTIVVIGPGLTRAIEGIERGGGSAAVSASMDEVARAIDESHAVQVAKEKLLEIEKDVSCNALWQMASEGSFPSASEWSDMVVEAFVNAGFDAARIPESVQAQFERNLMPAVLASVPLDAAGQVTDESASDVYGELGCGALSDLELRLHPLGRGDADQREAARGDILARLGEVR
jgi:hypothetical protein